MNWRASIIYYSFDVIVYVYIGVEALVIVPVPITTTQKNYFIALS